MYEQNFLDALKRVLVYEGGFTDDAADPGGATNFGIIQSEYDRYRKSKKLLGRTVKEISQDEVKELYYAYWENSRAKYLPEPLAYVVFDTGVNFGVGRVVEFINTALGLAPTTAWQNEASALIHSIDPRTLATAIVALRMEYRGRRVLKNKTQMVFLAGWLNRDRSVLDKLIGK